jgi:hypothetical protein
MTTVYIVIRSDWRSDKNMEVYFDRESAEQHAASITKHQVIGSVEMKVVKANTHKPEIARAEAA